MNTPKTSLKTPEALDKPAMGDAAGAARGHPRSSGDEAARPRGWRLLLAGLVQVALIALIAVAAWQGRTLIIESAPTAERTPRERVARLVEVARVELAERGPIIEVWGEVVPAQTLIVRPEVGGTVTWVDPNLTRGGRMSAGDTAVKLDDRDLLLAVRQADADIAEIRARMQIEAGQASLGQRELTRLSRNITQAQRDLVLRKPQMAQLEAELAAADAAAEQARNALARAEVKVPFDALVVSESVAPGAMVAQGAEAATLVAADRFHVTLAVPASALGWLRFDGSQTVTLTQPGVWAEGQSRAGTILRLGAGLTETGRMVEVIVAVDDPLAMDASGQPPLLLDSFVRARIEGPPIPQAVSLDRAHLRDGDTVWVMTEDGKLDVRDVAIAWRGGERALVTDGLAPGERVVTTYLATFAPGMALRTEASGDGGGA